MVRADEIRPVTSLFADVVGSTSLGERLPTIEVKAIVGECVTRMCETIEAFGGHVGAYMGDGIAAFFGLESVKEHQAIRAARAGLEIQRVIGAYAQEVEATWGVRDFNVRVGINTGRVAVGIVGAANPQVLALGDPVNVAARLQGAARPGCIVVGSATATALRERFALRPMGDVGIRGRGEAVQAFELEGEGGVTAPRSSAAFVGREPQIAELSAMLDELASGRGQGCVITGDGGIGKSRLLRELRVRAPSDILWLDGRCDSIDGRTPYEPFVQILREWLGINEGTSSIEARVRLRARGSELLGDDFDDAAAHLAKLLNVDLSPKLSRRLDGLPPDVLSKSLQDAYATWLIALARIQPVVVAVDNFEFASSAVVEMTQALLSVLERAPVFLVFALRPEPTQPAWLVRSDLLDRFVHRATELRLTPLSADESFALLDERDADGQLNENLRELVVSRAEGNPLYVEELCGAMTGSDAAPSEDVHRELPSELESLLLSRIDSLPAPARGLLQAAAVFGRTFPRASLDSMCGTSTVEEHLHALLRIDIIRESGREPVSYVFRHGLLRDAAVATLTPARLAELSATAAQALVRSPTYDADRDAETLARFYLNAGDTVAAIACMERQGDHLSRVFRFDEAAAIFNECRARSLQFGISAEAATVKLVGALGVLGRSDEALRVIDDALFGAGVQDRAPMLVGKIERLADLGRMGEAHGLAESLLDGELAPDVRSQTLVLRGRLALATQDLGLAERCVAEVGELDTLSPELRFEVTSLMAGILATEGDFEAAERWALDAQGLADKIGRMTDQLAARRHVALICVLKGCVREAYELMSYVYRRYRDISYTTGQLEAAVNLLHTAYLAGELRDGAAVAAEALELCNGGMWRGLLLSNACGIYRDLKDLESAQAAATEVLTFANEGATWPSTGARIALAEALMDQGDAEGAFAEAERAKTEASKAGREGERVLVDLALAEFARNGGDLDAALSHVERAREVASSAERIVSVFVDRIYGSVLAQREDPDAVGVLKSALARAQQMGMRLEEGRIGIALGVALPGQSVQHFAAAQRIFEESGCARGLDELKDARARQVSSPAR